MFRQACGLGWAARVAGLAAAVVSPEQAAADLVGGPDDERERQGDQQQLRGRYRASGQGEDQERGDLRELWAKMYGRNLRMLS